MCRPIAPSTIERVATKECAIIDVDLLSHGYHKITVLDISRRAIEENSGGSATLQVSIGSLPTSQNQITKLALTYGTTVQSFILTKQDDRIAWVRQAAHAVKPGGHVIVSTFGPEGPTKCSGLDVVRYDAESLHREFGVHLRLPESVKELHQTPFGTVQQFLYCHGRIE